MSRDFVTGLPKGSTSNAYSGPVKFEGGVVVKADSSQISSPSVMTNQMQSANFGSSNNKYAKLLGLPNCTDAQALQLRHKVSYMTPPPVIEIPYQLDNADGSPIKGDPSKPTIIDNSKNFDREATEKWYNETFVTNDPQGRTGVLKAPDANKLKAMRNVNFSKPANITFPYEQDSDNSSLNKDLTPYQQSTLNKINQHKDAISQRFGQNVISTKTLNRNTVPKKENVVPQYTTSGYEQKGTEINGKIDKDFSQGQTENCWFLGAVQAIRERKGGQEYLNSLVSLNEQTGDVTVNLKGVNTSYTIPKSEIESRNQLSSGDGDVRALEIAMDRYMKEKCPDRRNNGINGGYPTKFAMDVLIGKSQLEHDNLVPQQVKQESFVERDGVFIPQKTSFQTPYWAKTFDVNNFNKDNKAYTVSFAGNTTNSVAAISTTTNEVKSLINNHAYSVVKSDGDFVYVRNTHNTAEILKIAINDFNALNSSIYSTNL